MSEYARILDEYPIMKLNLRQSQQQVFAQESSTEYSAVAVQIVYESKGLLERLVEHRK